MFKTWSAADLLIAVRISKEYYSFENEKLA